MVNIVIGPAVPDWYFPFLKTHPLLGPQLWNLALGFLAYIPVAAVLGLLMAALIRRGYLLFGLIGVLGFLLTQEIEALIAYLAIKGDTSPPPEAQHWVDTLTYLGWLRTRWWHLLQMELPLMLVMAVSLPLFTRLWGRLWPPSNYAMQRSSGGPSTT